VRRFAARIREDYAMKPRLLIPLLLLPVACGPKPEPAATASAAPPTTMVMSPSPSGQTLVVEVVMVDTAAPSITLRAGDVPAGTPKASDLKTGDRTIRVEPAAAASLAAIKPGMRVRVTCSAPLPVTTDAASSTTAASPAMAASPGKAASPAMAPATTLAAAAGPLAGCDSVVAITSQEPVNP
jgi:hypothetical protein